MPTDTGCYFVPAHGCNFHPMVFVKLGTVGGWVSMGVGGVGQGGGDACVGQTEDSVFHTRIAPVLPFWLTGRAVHLHRPYATSLVHGFYNSSVLGSILQH